MILIQSIIIIVINYDYIKNKMLNHNASCIFMRVDYDRSYGIDSQTHER